ncbi:hypothetical protein F53441_7026 [Fusarium austroafricanum]|uniref:Uncharacterized protein n=1 Tax=Fusarium austroafricanum TaxID=2364996 RepID=A0A8H4KHD8_9HYPO|nr:hypothetical protein F53441_7026 [Fusarium austroafricanum]
MAASEPGRLILHEDIVNDERFSPSRAPKAVLRNHQDLTREDKLALKQYAEEYAFVVVYQQGQTCASSKKLLKKFYTAIFDMWSTTQRHNPPPLKPTRTLLISEGVKIGSLKQDCPATPGQEVPKARQAGQPVSLKLSIKPEAGSIEWIYEDED